MHFNCNIKSTRTEVNLRFHVLRLFIYNLSKYIFFLGYQTESIPVHFWITTGMLSYLQQTEQTNRR